MSTPKTIKRLVICFGSIQLVTALSVLSYREKQQQELNPRYDNYLVITPLFAPQGQDHEFAAFIEKMAKSLYIWERVVYIPLEQKYTLMKKFNKLGLSRISSLIHELLGSQHFDEIYLSHEYDFEDQLLMNIYDSAEKICYGNGIGIYTQQSAFPLSVPKDLSGYLNRVYASFKKQIKSLLPQKHLLDKQEFDIGYFSLPSAFGQVPKMESIMLERHVYLETFQRLSWKLSSLIDINYVNHLYNQIQSAPISILLTSNFSEAAGRMSLDNEIAAYREFLETQGIDNNSILLIKPHPRDSKAKILKLKSALSDLYADIVLLTEDFLFYLPFELLFIEVFLNPDRPQTQSPKIFTFSSASLTLELILNVQCVVGFGSEIVNKFFYPDHASDRIKHEADLLSTIGEIRNLSVSLV